mmetsp:Transcript_104813/g.306098  ORF Transcript_104813/g.306098 Transcript_104813/m.306098 type:complete len:140 (-) Transcript_104813:55-474(-)
MGAASPRRCRLADEFVDPPLPRFAALEAWPRDTGRRGSPVPAEQPPCEVMGLFRTSKDEVPQLFTWLEDEVVPMQKVQALTTVPQRRRRDADCTLQVLSALRGQNDCDISTGTAPTLPASTVTCVSTKRVTALRTAAAA